MAKMFRTSVTPIKILEISRVGGTCQEDGGVEGRELTPSYKNTKITTNC